MDNKDFVNLLLKEINEMSLICESLSTVEEIPSSLLLLSKGKVDSMSQILNKLLQNAQIGTAINKAEQERESVNNQLPFTKESEEKVSIETTIESQCSNREEKLSEEACAMPEAEPLENQWTDNDDKAAAECETDECETGKQDDAVTENSVDHLCVKEQIADVDQTKVEASTESVGAKITTEENHTAFKLPTKPASAESRFVKSLKLCLGDKFRYKKELFGDDMNLLNQTMAELDKLNSMEEAFMYVERFHWDETNPAVEDFLSLLQNRFS